MFRHNQNPTNSLDPVNKTAAIFNGRLENSVEKFSFYNKLFWRFEVKSFHSSLMGVRHREVPTQLSVSESAYIYIKL